jgi:hypothetical protein
MAVCADCADRFEDAAKGRRRTKCYGCDAKICSFCYQMHKDARAAGDGCLLHMYSVIEERIGHAPSDEEYKRLVSE